MLNEAFEPIFQIFRNEKNLPEKMYFLLSS